MTSQAVLRAMRAEDMPRIERIVRRTWSYDDRVSARAAELLGRIDACNCLSRRTYMRVADIDGDVAGFIVVNDLRNPRRDMRLQAVQAVSMLRLLASRDGREGLTMFRRYMATDRRLDNDAREQGRHYDGEIVLFIVNDEYRGYGLGRLLFDDALRHFREIGVEDFFLYTDTDCDFGFYEHRGMSRRAARSVSITLGGHTESAEMYIYDDVVSRQLGD